MTSPPAPAVSKVEWAEARRIISTRHPPIDLFEDIADPADWPLLAAGEMRTNPRLAETIGNLDLVPPHRRVGGDGASWVMAPFVHVSSDRAGRFHDGTFGAYYAAERFETAVAETSYHQARFLRATGEPPGWLTQMRELVGSVSAEMCDLRGSDKRSDLLDPDDYGAGQAFARSLRADGFQGVVYPSVRDPGGTCLAAFWPDVVSVPVPGRLLAYHFDGSEIDMVRDESSGDVFRLVRP